MASLRELYEEALQTRSDINEHLKTLYDLARHCEHVTEMGTRRGLSTRAFLYARPREVVCYDLERRPEVDILEYAARASGWTQFVFYQVDVLQIEIEETDLLFIDTLHVYNQLKRELALHADKARKYLVLHDTTTYSEVGEWAGFGGGIWPAIEEFLVVNPAWKLTARLVHNNGLTILTRDRAFF